MATGPRGTIRSMVSAARLSRASTVDSKIHFASRNGRLDAESSDRNDERQGCRGQGSPVQRTNPGFPSATSTPTVARWRTR